MPHFDGLQLILDDGFTKDESVTVTMASRSMIHFVERRLAAIRYESEFTKLNIHVSKSPVDDHLIRYKEPKRFIGIKIQMDPGEFIDSSAAFQQTCAEMIRTGICAASRHVDLPVGETVDAMNEFIDGGFINRWIQADKTWTRVGYRSVIRCDLRTDAFVLTQIIYRDGELLEEAMVARTKPREWLFYPLLGTLTLSGSQISYRAKKRLLSCYDLNSSEFELSHENIEDPFSLSDGKAIF